MTVTPAQRHNVILSEAKDLNVRYARAAAQHHFPKRPLSVFALDF
jgi:hypothetical protein